MKLDQLPALTGDALRNAGAYLADFAQPTVRLGVTGLARAGKTVFITALVRSLIEGGRLPFFTPLAEGRIVRAWLEPQPDDGIPRFAYEQHLATLAADPPAWPESTRQISQLRLAIAYQPAGRLRRALGAGRLTLDIIDYPGEWLIDLPLVGQDFATWSAEAVTRSREPARANAAAPWLQFLANLPAADADPEPTAIAGARAFTDYLAAARARDHALSTLGPGRFLIPGDLAGSPLVTFFPLPAELAATNRRLAQLLARRYESYRSRVVLPFFRDHFSRLDRQIVLVDALSALNAGRDGVTDLERTLAAVLACFRTGSNSWASALFRPRVDRVVFAATKADHLHHTSHDRLEALMAALVDKAERRATFAGAEIKTLALAALRATREAEARQGGERLPCIVGVPLAGERVARKVFDGRTEAVVFPGDLPADPARLLGDEKLAPGTVEIVRFRPPVPTSPGADLPHIRLDRALDFLLGDKLG